jgi:hypothetical protein
MIYWFTGNVETNTEIFSNKLSEFLQTEKRNWRKDVFYINDEDVEGDIHIAQIISNFIQSKGSDVVVDILSADRESLNNFKDKIGLDIIEIHVFNSRKKNKDINIDTDTPNPNLFIMDTCSENTNQSFSKLINYLKAIEKL